MNLILHKSEMIELLELYYREIENRKVKVSIKTTIGSSGYGMQEHEECLVTIIATETIFLLGKTHLIKKQLLEEEVCFIASTILKREGFEVQKMEIDAEMRSISKGYGMNEQTSYYPYFNGIIFNLDRKLENNKIRKKVIK